MGPVRRPHRLFGRGSWPEASRIADVLRQETVGGALLLAGRRRRAGVGELAVGGRLRGAARHTVGPGGAAPGPDRWATWAADGLLAIFFFVAGLELKREFVAGDLRDPRRAALPVAAAVGGMVVPALLYVLINSARRRRAARAGRSRRPPTSRSRWRCWRSSARHLPTRAAHLPAHPRRGRRPAGHHHHRGASTPPTCSRAAAAGALRAAGALHRAGAAAGPVLVAAAAAGRSRPGRWCTPPGCTPPSPGCCSASPCRCCAVAGGRRTGRRPGPRRALRAPLAAALGRGRGAGLRVLRRRGRDRRLVRAGRLAQRPVAIGIVVGLVVGKTVGIFGATCLVSGSPAPTSTTTWPGSTSSGVSCSPASASPSPCSSASWPSATGSERDDHVKVAVLAGSLLAAVLAGDPARPATASTAASTPEESVDADHDGIPDVYERDDDHHGRFPGSS